MNADLYLTASADDGTKLIRKLCIALEGKSPRGFRCSFQHMPEETHISVVHRSIYSGLDTIFDGWHLANPFEMYVKGGLEAIHRHFREGGKRAGYDRQTPAFTISMVVHGLMREGRLEEAASVLLHDPKRYPAPWNQLDALARAYAKRGDAEKEIPYYTLSLRAKPDNEHARKRLAELGVDVEALVAHPRE